MFGVIMSHSLAADLHVNKFSLNWYLVNGVLGLVSPAVGLFFMTSGYLILSSAHTKDLGYLVKHRLVKILVPFIIWSGISVAALMILNNQLSFGPWLQKMLLLYHDFPIVPYWFIYPLIVFYVLSPVIKKFVDNADNKLIDYALLIWFLTNILLPFIVAMLPKSVGVYFQANDKFNLLMVGQTLGYFILGYRIGNAKLEKKTLNLNIIAMILLFAITIVINYENNIFHINIPVIGYDSAIAVILTAMIFLVFKKFEMVHPGKHNPHPLLTELSKLSYGIYLMHGFVISYVFEMMQVKNFFLVFLITSVICLVVIYLISKIPYLRYWMIGFE